MSAERPMPTGAQVSSVDREEKPSVRATDAEVRGQNAPPREEDRSTSDGPDSIGEVARTLDERNDKPLEPGQRGT